MSVKAALVSLLLPCSNSSPLFYYILFLLHRWKAIQLWSVQQIVCSCLWSHPSQDHSFWSVFHICLSSSLSWTGDMCACMPVNTHTRISTHTQRYTCVRMQMKTKITDVVCLHYIVSFVPYKLQCKYLLLCVYWILACMRVWDFVNVCDLGCVCTAHLLFTTLTFYCTCKGQFYLYCRFEGHLTLYYCCVLIFV